MKSVFISYSTADTTTSEQIRDQLEAAGIACWMAPRDINPGEDYAEQIIKAIEGCTVLLLVLSETSNHSQYVIKEIERAIAKRKVVIPFRIHNVTPSRSLEFFISNAQWIDAWDEQWTTATAALYSAVRDHLRRRAKGEAVRKRRSNKPVPEIQPSALHPPSPFQRPPSLERAVFVERKMQLAQLEEALAETLHGHGQLRFITGEAGAGKSALLNEFHYRATAGAADLFALAGGCDAQTGLTDPYLPFREILGRLAGDRAMSQILLEQGPVLIGTLVPAAALGSHGRGARPAAQAGSVEQHQIFEETVKVLQAIASRWPLLLVLEDLHWADDATVGLLFRLGRQLAGSRILVLGAYRSEEVRIGWGGEPHPLQKIVDELRRNLGEIHIDLDAARAREGVTLVDALLDTEPNRLDAPFRQALYEHTGGLPLFVVELLRDMQKSGALVQDTDGQWIIGAELNWAELPARVEGMIAIRMARLDAEERQLLTTASVMGEHFIAEAVAQTLKIDARQVALQLSGSLQKQHRLVQGEGVERLGPQRLTHYRFSHNLMQVYLYEQLDKVERSFLHEDVGYVLEALYGEQVAPIAVQLARHFQVASLTEKAVHYLTLAGEQAVRVVAYPEASSHFTQALAQLATLQETTERVQRELALLLSLGAVLTALKGYTDPEVTHTYSRMRSILPKLGQDPQIFPALTTLERFYSIEGEFQLRYEVAEQALQLARAAQDPKLLVGGHQVMGTTLYFISQFVAARAHFEQSLALYDPQAEYTFILPGDPGVIAGIFLGWTLWHLGFADQALLRSQEALRLAQRLTNRPFPETSALSLLAMFHQCRRDAPAARQAAEACMGLAMKHGFAFLEDMARVVYGWALAAQGEIAAGMAQMHSSVAAIRTKKAVVYLSPVLAMLAETYGKADQVKEGLTLAAEALAMADRSFPCMEVDLHLVRATLQLQQANGERAAEASLQRALALAQAQESKIMELRATVHLARLWRTQGKSQEAQQMLAERYGWFSEGFDSVDFREAKALLDQLQMAGT